MNACRTKPCLASSLSHIQNHAWRALSVTYKTMLGELSQSHTKPCLASSLSHIQNHAWRALSVTYNRTAKHGSRGRVVLRCADSIEGRAASPLSAVLLHLSTGVEQGCGRPRPDTFPLSPFALEFIPARLTAARRRRAEKQTLLRDPWEVPLLTSLGRAALSSDAAAR
jgi:hypothetical protein